MRIHFGPCMKKLKYYYNMNIILDNFKVLINEIKLYQISNDRIYVELKMPLSNHTIQITDLAKSFENTHKKSIFDVNEKETEDFIQNIISNLYKNKEIFLEEFGNSKTDYNGYSICKTLHPMSKTPLWLAYNNKLSDNREIIKMFFDKHQYSYYNIRLYFCNSDIECVDIVCAPTDYINCICKALELENGIIKSIVVNPMYKLYIIELEQNAIYFKSLKTYKYINNTFKIINWGTLR